MTYTDGHTARHNHIFVVDLEQSDILLDSEKQNRKKTIQSFIIIIIIMKFYLATALYCLSVTTANAFSAVAPNAAKASLSSGGAPSLDPIDKTMSGLPKEETNTFDPTVGENAALQRNNKNEVWVPQVRTVHDMSTRRWQFQYHGLFLSSSSFSHSLTD